MSKTPLGRSSGASRISGGRFLNLNFLKGRSSGISVLLRPISPDSPSNAGSLVTTGAEPGIYVPPVGSVEALLNLSLG